MPGEDLVLARAFPEVEEVSRALRDARISVAVAESCTGGLLGAVLTALPGSSDYMRGGVIAYADAVKADVLGVSRHLLAEHGAVSEPVALAMAAGARERCRSDIAVAVTGIAGPASVETSKPAGLIYIALVDGMSSRVERVEGDRGRDGNRGAAVRLALRLCLDAALGAGSHPGG